MTNTKFKRWLCTIAALALAIVTPLTVTTTAPASAVTDVPQCVLSRTCPVATGYSDFAYHSGQTAWWNLTNGADEGYDFNWNNWPVPSGANGLDAAQVLWLHDANESSMHDTRVGLVRNGIRGAVSIFAASAQRFIYNDDDNRLNSLTPRIITNSDGSIQVIDIAVPHSVWTAHDSYADDGGTGSNGFRTNCFCDAWDTPGGLIPWLQSQGYNRPDRKYIALLQGGWPTSWGPAYAGAAGLTGNDGNDYLDPNPATNREDGGATSSTYSLIDPTTVIGDPDNLADYIAHEYTHNLGAVESQDPQDNIAANSSNGKDNNPGHPTQCNDLLCYGGTAGGAPENTITWPGETYTDCTPARAAYRLDCLDDDYWAPAQQSNDGRNSWSRANPSPWTQTYWAVSNSSFLWGNPSLHSSATGPGTFGSTASAQSARVAPETQVSVTHVK